MKKFAALATGLGLLAIPTLAFAQSSASPNNTSGPNIDPTVQSPTDMGIGSADSNRRGVPSRMGTSGSTVIETPAQPTYVAPPPGAVTTEPPPAVVVHPSSQD